MQADDQSARSPPHSLSLDHSVPNQSLPPSGQYNSLNMHIRSKSNSQEGMLLSLPAEYSTSNVQHYSYKNQARKVMKKQTANIDDFLYPYDDKYSHGSGGKDAPSSYGRFTHANLDANVKGKDFSKFDSLEYREDSRKSGANYMVYCVETKIKDTAKKGNVKTDFYNSGHKQDKYTKPSKNDKPIYLCDADFVKLDVTNNESSEFVEKESSASKIYESMCKFSNVDDKSLIGDKNKNGKIVNTYLTNIDKFESDMKGNYKKVDKHPLPAVSHPVKIYESMVMCSNDVNKLNTSFAEKSPYKMLGSHYVDMGSYNYERKVNDDDDKNYIYSKVAQDSKGRKKSGRVVRRHTTEFRAPPNLALPLLNNDSSDSAEVSPAVKAEAGSNYFYSDQKIPKKYVTSSTSEDNSDSVATALKMRMQAKEWRDNKPQKRVDCATVDRRPSRKNSTKSAKIKRRGSLNIIDPMAGLQVSNQAHNCEKSHGIDARKKSLQISVEDMVQIANCGATNKNGSLCHFISSNNDNYISISQALLDQTSNGDFKAPDKKPGKQTLERLLDRKSTHSLVLGEDALSRDNLVNDLKNYFTSKQFEYDPNLPTKFDTVDRFYKGHSRQRSHDLGKSLKLNKQKYELSLHRKSPRNEAPYDYPPSYYMMQNDGRKFAETPRKDKKSNASCEALDDSNECRCSMSNHSLLKPDAYQETGAGNKDTAKAFHRYGNSSREELANSDDVEETFDF